MTLRTVPEYERARAIGVTITGGDAAVVVAACRGPRWLPPSRPKPEPPTASGTASAAASPPAM